MEVFRVRDELFRRISLEQKFYFTDLSVPEFAKISEILDEEAKCSDLSLVSLDFELLV